MCRMPSSGQRIWGFSGRSGDSRNDLQRISLGAMNTRPVSVTLLALLLGLYAAAAGGLVLVSLATRPVHPPIWFILLDLSIVTAASVTAASVWRRARWANRALLVLVALLATVLWAHLLAAEAAPMTETWRLGAIGTFVLASAALLGNRYLRNVTRASE